MNEPSRQVTVNERMPSLRFHRYVDEKIKDWIREHHLMESDAQYEVSFFDEDSLGEISCLVILNTGENRFKSWEAADNPRLALSRSLEHLHEDIPEPGETIQTMTNSDSLGPVSTH